jgi:hypothetical protein
MCPEAIALVKRLNDVHMNYLPWHELQAWRSDGAKSDWEEHRRYDDKGTAKQVHLAGCKDGLVEQTVEVVKQWLVCAAPRPVSECAQMDDTDMYTASDVDQAVTAVAVLDASRYPEDSACLLKNELQLAQSRDNAKRKREEKKLKLEEEAKRKKEQEDRAKAEEEAKRKKDEEDRLMREEAARQQAAAASRAAAGKRPAPPADAAAADSKKPRVPAVGGGAAGSAPSYAAASAGDLGASVARLWPEYAA